MNNFQLCIGECDRVLPIEKFSFTGRKNQSCRRKVCNQCHGVKCYQKRLNDLLFTNKRHTVSRCEICSNLYKTIHGVDKCVRCRKKAGELTYNPIVAKVRYT